MKKCIALILTLVLAFTMTAAMAAPTYSFKFSITQSSTDPIATYAQQMIDEIEEKTNGDIQIVLHPNGELGAINDVNELIAMGAEIINYTGADAFNATVPDLAILNCQYCLSDPSQMALIQQSDWFKDQVDTLAQQGNVRLLCYRLPSLRVQLPHQQRCGPERQTDARCRRRRPDCFLQGAGLLPRRDQLERDLYRSVPGHG